MDCKIYCKICRETTRRKCVCLNCADKKPKDKASEILTALRKEADGIYDRTGPTDSRRTFANGIVFAVNKITGQSSSKHARQVYRNQ